MILNEDRLFPAELATRSIAKRLYSSVCDLPIISPHGHTNPRWFAENEPFPDPVQLFIVPDHYVFRMLYSQGVPLEQLGVGSASLEDPRRVWRILRSITIFSAGHRRDYGLISLSKSSLA
jgi:glucuronate isomerase